MDVTPPVIWTLGLPLLILTAISDPYWRGVASAAASGKAPPSGGDLGYPELWKAGGAVALLIALVVIADLSPAGGTFAALFLLALWILFLLAHTDALMGALQRLSGVVPTNVVGQPGRTGPPPSSQVF